MENSQQSMSLIPSSTPVGAPFDDEDADTIIRSSDSFDFLVYRKIVAKASPVLRNVLSPPGSGASQSIPGVSMKQTGDGRAVLHLPQSRDVLFILLSSVYPVSITLPEALEDIYLALEAAQKYGIYSALEVIRGVCVSQGKAVNPANCLRAFSLAYRHSLKPEAVSAARMSLDIPMTIEDLGGELSFTSGQSLYALLQTRATVANGIRGAISRIRSSNSYVESSLWNRPRPDGQQAHCNQVGPSGAPQWFESFLASCEGTNAIVPSMTQLYLAFEAHKKTSKCKFCLGVSAAHIHRLWTLLDSEISKSLHQVTFNLAFSNSSLVSLFHITPTPHDFGPPFNYATADIILRSRDCRDFRVHKSILAIASAFFQNMFTLPRTTKLHSLNGHSSSTDGNGDGLPVVYLSEDSSTMNSLLSLIYPVEISIPTTFDAASSIFAAAHKFEMESVTTNLRRMFRGQNPPAIDSQNAFRAYAVACKYQFAEEALTAAKLTLEKPMTFELYEKDLHLLDTGSTLYELSQYRARCRDAATMCIVAEEQGTTHSAKGAWSLWSSQRYYGRCLRMELVGPHRRDMPRWWLEHLRQVIRNLKLGVLFPSPRLIAGKGSIFEPFKAHLHDGGCSYCSQVYADGIYSLLESQVQAAVDKVSLNMP